MLGWPDDQRRKPLASSEAASRTVGGSAASPWPLP